MDPIANLWAGNPQLWISNLEFIFTFSRRLYPFGRSCIIDKIFLNFCVFPYVLGIVVDRWKQIFNFTHKLLMHVLCMYVSTFFNKPFPAWQFLRRAISESCTSYWCTFFMHSLIYGAEDCKRNHERRTI